MCKMYVVLMFMYVVFQTFDRDGSMTTLVDRPMFSSRSPADTIANSSPRHVRFTCSSTKQYRTVRSTLRLQIHAFIVRQSRQVGGKKANRVESIDRMKRKCASAKIVGERKVRVRARRVRTHRRRCRLSNAWRTTT